MKKRYATTLFAASLLTLAGGAYAQSTSSQRQEAQKKPRAEAASATVSEPVKATVTVSEEASKISRYKAMSVTELSAALGEYEQKLAANLDKREDETGVLRKEIILIRSILNEKK